MILFYYYLTTAQVFWDCDQYASDCVVEDQFIDGDDSPEEGPEYPNYPDYKFINEPLPLLLP